MTWAPSFGPARPATYTATNPSPPAFKPYTKPVSLIKQVQGDIVYSDHCRRGIPADLGCIRHHNKIDESNGYVRMSVNGRKWWAHRYYYTLRHGPIAPGLQIDHLCRNRWCMNLKHMEAVTHRENLARAIPYRVKTYKRRNAA